MAIKGKKRSRGGRAKARSAAPKPKLVEVKPPLAQRRWFRLAALAVVAAGVVTAGLLIWGEVQANREREAAQKAVARTGVAIENALIPVGEPIPGGGGVIVLTELSTTLQEIQSGEFKERQVLSRVEEWQGAVADAQEALDEIETDNNDLRRAIRAIREGLGLYTGVVNTVPDALDVEGEERDARLAEIQAQLQTAAARVDSGWLIYRNERIDVGLDEGLNAGVDTQVPPGFPPGGELPPGFPPGGEVPPGFPPGGEVPPGFAPGEEVPIPEAT